MFNKVIIAGNLTRDPEKKDTSAGAVTKFSIAVSEKYKKGDEWVENTDYFDIVVFKRQAETCNQYLSKGSRVLVEGKLKQGRWEAQDGTKRSKVEVMANKVVFLSEKKQSEGEMF
jgi:single-strand DNA-binding protein